MRLGGEHSGWRYNDYGAIHANTASQEYVSNDRGGDDEYADGRVPMVLMEMAARNSSIVISWDR